MKKKSLCFTVVFLSGLFLIPFSRPVLQAADPKFGGTLKVAMIGEPPTIDGHWTTATIVSIISHHYLEPLFTFGDKYNIIPMLAESYKIGEGERFIPSN